MLSSLKAYARGAVGTAASPFRVSITYYTMGHVIWDEDEDLEVKFIDPAHRAKLEKELLWKIDKRMSILVLIYILNFVGAK